MRTVKALFTFLAVMLLVVPAGAQQLRNRVAPICTDVSDTGTAQEAGFIPCDWYQTGTGAATPGYVRIVDRNSTLTLDVQRLDTILAGLATTHRGIVTASTLWLYEYGGDFFPWFGREPDSDTLSEAAMRGATVLASNFFYNINSGRFMRDRGDVADSDAVVNTTTAPYRLTLGHIQLTDGAVWARDSGEIADGGDIAATRTGAYRLSLNFAWDADAGNWNVQNVDTSGNLKVGVYDTDGDGPWNLNTSGEGDVDLEMINGNDVAAGSGAVDAGTLRVIQATDGPSVTTAAPAYARQQDGDSTVLRDVLDTVADDLAVSLNWGASVSVVLLYDGTTLDMARAGANGGMNVEVLNWPNSYDAGNAWNAGFKKDIGILNYSLTGTAVDDAGTDVICASTYVLNTPNWTVWAKNAGGGSGDAFADVDVQASYDGTDWSESLTSTACDTLASGASAMCYTGSNLSYAYVRVVANTAAADDTTGDCWIQGNKN